MSQVGHKLLALRTKLKAEVKDPPGAEMHAIPFALASVSEIAGPRSADALNPAVLLVVILANVAMALSAALIVSGAVARIGKYEQVTIVSLFALALAVLAGTAEHVFDEAPAVIYELLWVVPKSRRVYSGVSQMHSLTGRRALGDTKNREKGQSSARFQRGGLV